jgi:hypothetical protein
MATKVASRTQAKGAGVTSNSHYNGGGCYLKQSLWNCRYHAALYSLELLLSSGVVTATMTQNHETVSARFPSYLSKSSTSSYVAFASGDQDERRQRWRPQRSPLPSAFC